MLSEKGNKVLYNEETVQELTVVPNKMQMAFIKTKPEPTTAFFVEGEYMYTPRFYNKSKEQQWRPTKKATFHFKGALREYQKKPIKESIKELQNNGSMILSLGTGGGKTCMALYIMAVLGMKTLIIVNKEILLDQWVERINQFIYPPPKIGIIQGKNATMGPESIHIAMLQTISKKEISYNHSFMILDECHNVATKSFSNAFKYVACKYQLGLSATPTRADGLTKVLKWYLGDIKNFKRDEISTNLKKVLAISYINPYPEIKIGKDVHFSLMLSKMAKDKKRTAIIVAQIGLQMKNGYILVLSDRIAQLQAIHKILGSEISVIYAGKLGKNKAAVLELAKTKRVLLSTYAMVSEGVDIPHLNILIFATPRSNVTQSVGRIGRKSQNCLLIDVVDRYEYTERQLIKREMIYKQLGYDKTKRVGVKIS